MELYLFFASQTYYPTNWLKNVDLNHKFDISFHKSVIGNRQWAIDNNLY